MIPRLFFIIFKALDTYFARKRDNEFDPNPIIQ